MTIAAWKIGLAIAVGSLGGALLRQLLITSLGRVRGATPRAMLTASSGGVFGGTMGAVMGTTALAPEHQ